MKDLSPSWLNRARGSFQRAASNLYNDIANTNLDDKEACRILNNRIMMVMHVLQDLCWVVCCNLKKLYILKILFCAVPLICSGLMNLNLICLSPLIPNFCKL